MCSEKDVDVSLSIATKTCLAFALDKCVDYWSSIATWMPRGTVGHTFSKQAIQMTWDFPEASPLVNFHCAWHKAFNWVEKVCTIEALAKTHQGRIEIASATQQLLPNDSVDALITDPPYYFSVQYSDLSDFFYVWLRRTLEGDYSEILKGYETPKEEEIIVQSPGHEFAKEGKNNVFYESRMNLAMAENLRVLSPNGISIVVFAHTSTSGWEAMLQAMVNAGWTITGSWTIDTERSARSLAQNRSVLASSVHLVCRPRSNNEIGDWRDVLQELPQRIKEWMLRLTDQGVVGADAIFACLGPALEIFSCYSSVEKASGEIVTLREYLEYVWAAVSKEALSNIFKDADTSSFEEDARLTAMWLWTLSSGDRETGILPVPQEEEDVSDDDGESTGKKAKITGFSLEYDAARKIAQGLGTNLENLSRLIQVKGDKARLLPVSERSQHLFGKDAGQAPVKRPKKDHKQLSLFDTSESTADEVSEDWGDTNIENPGKTVLDRIHQTMILFAAGRSEALKRFLVDDGVGSDKRFWTLAQSLSALYPAGTDEKRWVDGVLARKKGLGF
jgi:hypothetical protein